MSPDREFSTTATPTEHAIDDMLLFIVRSVVDHPEDVEVEFFSDEDGDTLQVVANQTDLGRLIGKHGQTAKAIELILNANGKKNGRRYRLDIVGTDDIQN